MYVMKVLPAVHLDQPSSNVCDESSQRVAFDTCTLTGLEYKIRRGT
jgi:hypothetical protein